MTEALSPQRWAIEISQVLNTVLGPEHFPINVTEVAREYSRQRFPEDPITLVAGDVLPRFDGALVRSPSGKNGWGIIYNNAIRSRGRINFTLAHEFGHYLLHRRAYPNGLQCGEQDVVRWDSQYGQIEYQANVFASYLLMPLDDFRRQIAPKDEVDLEMLGYCAARCEVSLIAATLKWIEYTERRAVVVVSREGFVLWARSSGPALRSGAFFRTSGPPIPVPAASQAGSGRTTAGSIEHSAGAWFREEACRETAVQSEQYDFTISLLLLSNQAPASRYQQRDDQDDDPHDDLLDRIRVNHGLS